MMKILFIVPYPTMGASNRIRVEQFIPYLSSKGIKCKVRLFILPLFYEILYMPGRHIEKTFWFIICSINRIVDIVRSTNYDIIFIHREAYPFGGAFFEFIFFLLGKPIIFDFDDAIFLPNVSKQNICIRKLKKPEKTAEIIRLSSLVIAGNDYLKQYALRYNENVVVVPSCVDTDKYFPLVNKPVNERVVIGWIGSNTTKNYLYTVENVLSNISQKYRNVIIKIVGADYYSPKINNLVNKMWSIDEEINDLKDFDIGIMPMPDDEWTKGKCGFKAILYMSMGIPCVCSQVGVNDEIIQDGINGYLAKNEYEWFKKISLLIENENLRRKIGMAGRKTVEEKYAVKANAPKMLEIIKNCCIK